MKKPGIGIYAYDKEVIPYLNKSLNFEKGLYVAQITKNSPADNTELKEGDIITKIDGIELNTMNDLRKYIYTKKPKDEVTLSVTRGKINKEIKLILEKNRMIGTGDFVRKKNVRDHSISFTKYKKCFVNEMEWSLTFFFRTKSPVPIIRPIPILPQKKNIS